MKTIGLIGGLSWESTAVYYRLINEAIKTRCGGFHSAKCVMYSVDFAEIEACESKNDWVQITTILTEAAQSLVKAGADLILVCSNTMHKLFDAIQANVQIPMLHIADAAAEAIRDQGINTVGLLGTKITMEQEFYNARLSQAGIRVIIPGEAERRQVDRVIFNELCLGKLVPESRAVYLQIIRQLEAEGAQGVVLGCTEIGLLVKQADVSIPVFDTAYLHALKAVEYALQEA